MELKEGDRVCFVQHEHQPVGTILSVDLQWGFADVKWDDEGLVPPIQLFSVKSFFDGTLKVLMPNLPYGSKCECGAEKVYGPIDSEYLHASWCPKYRAKGN